MTPAPSERRRSSEGRRAVRIVENRPAHRTATVTLLVASLAAILLFTGWRIWREDRTVIPPQRTLGDVQLRWKCESGHAFFERGQSDPRACPTCGRPAYPVDTYECAKHGAFEVSVRFANDPDGRAEVSELRLEAAAGVKGEWVFASDGLRCPKCGLPLHRQPADPLRGLGRGSAKLPGP